MTPLARVACLVLLLAGCARPRPTMKIALVAPFEGRWRDIGYQAFPAMRLALREQIAAGGIGSYQIEFVAYNDNGDPAMAARVARNVVLDGEVLAVIGHYRADTTVAAAGVYTAAGLPLLAPAAPAGALPGDALVFRLGPDQTARDAALRVAGCRVSPAQAALQAAARRSVPDLLSPAASRLYGAQLAGACFAADAPRPADWPAAQPALAGFPGVSGGVAPGPGSISAYDATRVLLEAIRLDVAEHGAPSRAGVAQALSRLSYDGLLGRIRFDAGRRWAQAPVWIYRFDSTGVAGMVR